MKVSKSTNKTIHSSFQQLRYINENYRSAWYIDQTKAQLQQVQFLNYQHFVENDINQILECNSFGARHGGFCQSSGSEDDITSTIGYKILHSRDEWAKQRRFDCALPVEG